METDVLRMIADWLGRADLSKADGYNDVATEIELDASDPAMEEVGYIGDETRDRHVAERMDPPALRALYVMADGPATLSGELFANQGYRDTLDLRVSIRYVVKNPESEQAIRDSYLATKVILKSLSRWMANANAADRTRNSVCVIEATGAVAGPVREEVGDQGTVTSAVIVILRVRDGAAA